MASRSVEGIINPCTPLLATGLHPTQRFPA
jgi:hypothetical protein